MIKIEDVNSNTVNSLCDFLLNVPSISILDCMLDSLIKKASSLGLERLVSVADSYPTVHLFKSLDFISIERPIYIDEEEIKNTNFKDSILLAREI